MQSRFPLVKQPIEGLTWREVSWTIGERVGQLGSGEGFSAWARNELGEMALAGTQKYLGINYMNKLLFPISPRLKGCRD